MTDSPVASAAQANLVLERVPTGVAGLDVISHGGLPKARTTLVTGTAGSAKTVLAVQYLVSGIREHGEPGVFVTFEESLVDIKRNMRSLGWDLDDLESAGMLAFVDASPVPEPESRVAGTYDLAALLSRIEHAVTRTGAKRVSLDSVGALFGRFLESHTVRSELFTIVWALKHMEVTAVLTAERSEEYGEIARFGIEEFVTDNVIILRNVLEEERRRRTVEILKFRGAMHQKGEYAFTVVPDEGIVVLAMSGMQLTQRSSNTRLTSGIEPLDRMCGGGYFRDSIILLSGATGTGKTLTSTHFLGGGATHGERCLLFAFEESREQLFRNAEGWGMDFQGMEQSGLLRVECEYPETGNLEEHLLRMRRVIEDYQPQRIAVDSLSALERISTDKSFREFLIGLTSFIKGTETPALLTSTTPTLMGGTSITETHISTLTDTIVLLRYVEMYGEMRRGVTVLKMRGSKHDKDIREFTIDESGMHIGRPFTNVTGIVSGQLTHLAHGEGSRLTSLFEDESHEPPSGL